MENKKTFKTDSSLKLMDRVQQALSHYQYAYKTEQSYAKWIKEYVQFLGMKKVPENRYHKEIDSFFTYLSDERNLSDSSRKQAHNAIAFLYKRVFDVPIDIPIVPSKKRRDAALPVILSPSEVRQIFSFLKGRHLLMAQLLYGAGLRLMECVRLRLFQLNFNRHLIEVTPVKGGTKRKVMIPKRIRKTLFDHVETVRKLHEKDLEEGAGEIGIPGQFMPKYQGTQTEFIWQYVFPSKRIKTDHKNGLKGRTHVLESGLQKAVKTAVGKAGIQKKVSTSTFRHSFAVHLLARNVSINVVNQLMGHADIRTTQRYIQLLDKKDITELSPLDRLYRQQPGIDR